MCDCLEKIAADKSVEYHQNGKDACVQASITGDLSIVPFVVGTGNRDKGIIRRSKHRTSEGIKFIYCPICGEKNGGHQFAMLWHD